MLKGKNIELRALEPADVDLLYQWENSSELWHLSNTVAPFSRFVLEQYIMDSHQDIFTSKQLRLMIDKKENGNLMTIGTIDLFDFDPVNKRAGIGIMIVRHEQQQGYATEALQMLVNYCFNTLKLHQVYCNIIVDNLPSISIFKKAGFEVAGIKKDWIMVGKNWKDEYTLQLINGVDK